MTRWIFMLCLLAFGFCATASPAASWQDLLERQRPAATKRFVYGMQPDEFAELWLPAGKEKHPVVIMLHGGCWQKSIPGFDLMAGAADDLRQHGVAVWNIEYRSIGAADAGYPGTFLDVADAVDYLPRVAKKYNLDLSRVVALGHSAGGQLALWAAARGKLKKSDALYRAHPLKIKSVISLAGIADLASYRDSGPACDPAKTIDALVGINGANSYADSSPRAMLPLGVPQLIISGTQDEIVPPVFGHDYAAAAKAAGDKVEAMDIVGAEHIDLINPQMEAWGKIRTAVLKGLQ